MGAVRGSVGSDEGLGGTGGDKGELGRSPQLPVRPDGGHPSTTGVIENN